MIELDVHEFVLQCIEYVEQVAETGEPILITKKGVPYVRVVAAQEPPPEPPEPR